MSEEEVEVIELNSDEITSDYCDTFKLDYSEADMEITFAKFIEENKVKINSKVQFSPALLKPLILHLIALGKDFEKNTDNELSFLDKIIIDEE